MTCKNCETSLTPEQKFCPNCGELTKSKRLTLKSIIALFFSDLLSYDNKFLKTFKALTIKPEHVIDGYVQGFRKKYVNVISYLGLAITLIGLQFFVLRRFFPELLVADSFASSEAFKGSSKFMDINLFLESFYQYQGIITVIFIPIYALASALLFLDKRKYNLAEHFVINLYTNAHFFIFWFVFTMILLPLKINYNLFSQFALIPMLIYMTYTFKRLFKISITNSIIRVIAYYIMVFIVMMVFILIVAIGYGIYLGMIDNA